MTQQLKAKNFDIQPRHMLCHQRITSCENIIKASSLDTEVEETPMDNIDEGILDNAMCKVYGTSRKRLSMSLEAVGMSPVNLHVAVHTATRSCYKHQAVPCIKAPFLKHTIEQGYNGHL